MKRALRKIAENIKSKTGIDITIFSEAGEILTTTLEKEPEVICKMPPKSAGSGGILEDTAQDVTFFIINPSYSLYIGMVSGTGPVPRNYAFMVSSLLENAVIRSDETLSRTDGYRDILAGEYTKLQIQRFSAKYNVPKTSSHVFAIAADSKDTGEILSFLTQFDTNADNIAILMEDSIVAYVHYLDEDEEEYFSATEFANSLCNSLLEEAGIHANVGFGNVVKNVEGFPLSFRQAVSAIRMGHIIDAKSSVHSYREYLMVKMLEDIPQNVLQGYLDVLLDEKALEILEDQEMMETAEEFLNNSLNVSETSRHLFMHRNTLMYRLDKIENAMGLNIKHFSDAVTFRIIMIVHKLLKS